MLSKKEFKKYVYFLNQQAYIDDLFTNDNETEDDKDLIKFYNIAKRERKTIEAHK